MIPYETRYTVDIKEVPVEFIKSSSGHIKVQPYADRWWEPVEAIKYYKLIARAIEKEFLK